MAPPGSLARLARRCSKNTLVAMRAPPLRHLGLGALALLASCGPAVVVDPPAGTTTAATSTGPGNDAATTTPPSCTPDTERFCECADGRSGTQECGFGGDFEPCLCIDSAETSSTSSNATSSTTGSGEGTGGFSSGSLPPDCPEVDDFPCIGTLRATSNQHTLEYGQCTSLDGTLVLVDSLSDLSWMGCLTRITGQLVVEGTSLTDLSGFARLRSIDGTLEISGASELTRIGLPSLQQIGTLRLSENIVLETLDLPTLATISASMDVRDNPTLPTCELEEILAQVGPTGGSVCYQSNAADECAPLCP